MARQCIHLLLAVLIGLLSPVVLSQEHEAKKGEDQRRRLIEQKTRLVESLINSRKAQATANGREIGPRTELKLLDKVHEALANNQFEVASALLDDALRAAIRLPEQAMEQDDGPDNSVQQANRKSLDEQVTAYRGGIEDMAKQGNGEAGSIAARIDVLQKESAALADAGKFGAANRKMAEAYKLAVESLSRLRSGQTVTFSLKFDTPAAEYDYECRRYQSSEILLDMVTGEGAADEARRGIVAGFVREGRKLTRLAQSKAQAGDYKGAVASMEQASLELNRALQVMGVPVF